MPIIKRIIFVILTFILCISGTVVTHAQTDTEKLQNIQQKLDQKGQERLSVQKEIETIQQEVESLNTYISNNKEAMLQTQKQIAETSQLIEEKKQEIVSLEDKILSRKGVMEKRLLALQHDSSLNLLIRVFLESKSLNDFIQRASAVSALFNADRNILKAQQNDLSQIEADKKEIDQQEKQLKADQGRLVKQQAELNQNLQKRKQSLTTMRARYSKINRQMAADQNTKAGIEAQLKAAQKKIRKEQEVAQRQLRKEQLIAHEQQSQPQPPAVHSNRSASQSGNGEEMYVTATAYSVADSGSVTKLGYNIKQNPNLKLIAVDPSVIPLGKKVWVEGYGTAIAGDTGGAISGHRIDVLMPTKKAALSWGRKTVKVIILN